jgi:hypothetical protein
MHQRKRFIMCSALGTMIKPCAAKLISNSPLASSRQNCFAFDPEGLRLDRSFTTNNPS